MNYYKVFNADMTTTIFVKAENMDDAIKWAREMFPDKNMNGAQRMDNKVSVWFEK